MCCKDFRNNHSDKNDCFENKTSAAEKQRKFRIERVSKPDETFCRIKVDGCFIIDNNSKKCDYIFVRCENHDMYYVELKGLDIDTAYQQIITTIQQHFNAEKSQIHGFIITSKGIPSSNAKRRKMEEEFVKKYGKKLKFEKSPCIHKI